MASRAKHASSSGETAAKVKAACEECRTRKIKCDGARPECGPCRQKIRSCIFETEPDEFRITALKRKYAELAQNSKNNETLVRLLREKSREEALEIFERVRANESVESILSSLGKAADAMLRPEAEQELISAVEAVKTPSPSATESSASSTSPMADVTPSSVSPSQMRKRQPPNKSSIAFLVDAVTEPSSDDHIVAGSSAPRGQRIKHVVDLVTNRLEQGSSQHSLEKRKRLSTPTGLGSQVDARISSMPGSKLTEWPPNPLANKPRSQDQSWRRGLEHVKATDWSVYYTDDHEFLEIIKCYFVWENPTLGFVNEDSFWEGLAAGGSEFCNQSLIHGILAYGSKIYSLFYPDRAASAEHFALIEVTKLWDWNADATVPANTSAGLLVHATHTANGQDVDGQSYLNGATNLAVQSGLFSPERVSSCYPRSDPKLARARATFAWNVYTHSGYHTLTFNEPPIFEQEPSTEVPDVDENADSSTWEPLPLQGAPCPSLISSKRHARALLWRLGIQVIPLRTKHQRDPGSEEHWNETMALYHRFQNWHDTLGGRLKILHGVPPHVFSLHTDYHRCIIDLMRPFVNISKQPRRQEMSDQAHGITQTSHSQLRMLIHQMELQYPGLPLPLSVLLTPLVSVANETLHTLSGKGPMSDECFYFNLCLKMMKRMTGVYPIVQFLILGLKQIAIRQSIEIPDETQALLDSVEVPRRNSHPLNSNFPTHHDLLTTDLEASSLQSLINETNRLSLEQGGKAVA